jgi:hypothetical protein
LVYHRLPLSVSCLERCALFFQVRAGTGVLGAIRSQKLETVSLALLFSVSFLDRLMMVDNITRQLAYS